MPYSILPLTLPALILSGVWGVAIDHDPRDAQIEPRQGRNWAAVQLCQNINFGGTCWYPMIVVDTCCEYTRIRCLTPILSLFHKPGCLFADYLNHQISTDLNGARLISGGWPSPSVLRAPHWHSCV